MDHHSSIVCAHLVQYRCNPLQPHTNPHTHTQKKQLWGRGFLCLCSHIWWISPAFSYLAVSPVLSSFIIHCQSPSFSWSHSPSFPCSLPSSTWPTSFPGSCRREHPTARSAMASCQCHNRPISKRSACQRHQRQGWRGRRVRKQKCRTDIISYLLQTVGALC